MAKNYSFDFSQSFSLSRRYRVKYTVPPSEQVSLAVHAVFRLYLRNIFIGKGYNLSCRLDFLKLLQGILYNMILHFFIVRLSCICTHRNERSNCSWTTGLSYDRRKGGYNDCGNANLLYSSLHKHGRTMTGPSACGKDNGIYAFIL